ncbi:MAG: hypothetical protein R3F43_10725 [bacterium]
MGGPASALRRGGRRGQVDISSAIIACRSGGLVAGGGAGSACSSPRAAAGDHRHHHPLQPRAADDQDFNACVAQSVPKN